MDDNGFDIAPIMGVMLIALMLPLFSQQAPTQTGTLHGYVRNTSGSPVSGAEVNLDGTGGLLGTTGTDGYYVFQNIAVGAHTITVINAEDLGFEYKPVVGVNIVAGDNVKDIILTSPTINANLVGVIRDSVTLSAVVGATVELNGGITTTNSLGIYGFNNVSPGSYTVTINKTGYYEKIASITLAAGDNTLDVTLVPEGVPAAEFELSDLIVDPAQVMTGGQVGISVLVSNIGDLAGTCTVNCDVTPTTFTPLAIIPVQIDIEYMINMMITIMMLAAIMKMMTNAIK